MDFAKAKELIDQAEHVGILLPENPTLDCLVSAEVLAEILESQGKPIGFLVPVNATLLPRPSLFPRISASRPLSKEFIISVSTTQTPISQLRYEKHDDRLDIILSPKTASLYDGLVSFREGRHQCNAVLALNVPDLESWNRPAGVTPDFFTQVPLINLDRTKENKLYGEANLVDPERIALAEIVADFAAALGREEALGKPHATLLLAGVLAQTNTLRDPRIQADTLHVAAELLRLGADYGTAVELARAGVPLALLQLFGRASIRSRLEPPSVLWSFLTSEDFEKTGRTPADVPAVLRHFDDEFPPRRLALLLWQDPLDQKVRVTVSGEPTLLTAIESRESGQYQSPYLYLGRSFPAFREAEETLSALLKETL